MWYLSDPPELWSDWTRRYVETEDPAPLFETDDELQVQVDTYGEDDRRVLQRSDTMEIRLKVAGRKLVRDWTDGADEYEGLILLMYWLEDGEVVPIHVQREHTTRSKSEALNPHLQDLRGSRTVNFARWGDGLDHFIGGLSAVVFDQDAIQRRRYRRWAAHIFAEGRRLERPVYHMALPWHEDDEGPYFDYELGLKQLEYQIVTMARELYEEMPLNEIREGESAAQEE